MQQRNGFLFPYWDALEGAGLTVHGYVDLVNHRPGRGWCLCGTFQGQLLFDYAVFRGGAEEEVRINLFWAESMKLPLTSERIIEFGRRTIRDMLSYEQLHSEIEQSTLGMLDRAQFAEWLEQLAVVQAYLARRAAAATLAAHLIKPSSSP